MSTALERRKENIYGFAGRIFASTTHTTSIVAKVVIVATVSLNVNPKIREKSHTAELTINPQNSGKKKHAMHPIFIIPPPEDNITRD